ncbi:MAG: hypothetical protein V1799_00040 [bacterium]
MNAPQQQIDEFLGMLPVYELSSGQHRSTFEQIRNRLSSTSDFDEELKTLFKVEGFSDFALGLMFLADKLAKNPLAMASADDEERIFYSFRSAVGEDPGVGTPVEEPSIQEEPTFAALQPEEPAAEYTAEEPGSTFPMVEEESPTPVMEQPISESEPSYELPSLEESPAESFNEGSAGLFDEMGFSVLLDQFVEAMQGGDENRETLMNEVMMQCNMALSGEEPEDFKEFCQRLSEFLMYISVNQYLDDVRVMNILANISSPVQLWTTTAPDARAGLLEDATGPLREFKSMFE